MVHRIMETSYCIFKQMLDEVVLLFYSTLGVASVTLREVYLRVDTKLQIKAHGHQKIFILRCRLSLNR